MAILSRQAWEESQKNLPESMRASYEQYLEVSGISLAEAERLVAAQEGRSTYVADTVIQRLGTPTLVVPAGTTKLTPEQLRQVRGDTGQAVNVIDQATGKLLQFNPTTGDVFKGDIADNEGFYNFLNPRATGTGGRLYAGVASGTFVRNPDGTWTIGEDGTERTTAAGFARLMAQYGFDTSQVPPGGKVEVGTNGVTYQNKTFNGPAITPNAEETRRRNISYETYFGANPIGATPYNTPLVTPVTSATAPLVTPVTSATAPLVTPVTSATAPLVTPVTSATAPLVNPMLAAANAERKSAYDLLYQQMASYGLETLVPSLESLIKEGVSPSEFTLRMRDTLAYKQRFAANQVRINKGLRALSEAEYIALEDQYQDVMRRYGLPESYYAQSIDPRTGVRVQRGFETFIGLDVSPVEIEDRIQTAYDRVINANPEIGIALRNFYPSITNGDILAYALDPDKALDQIKRKITAAEIGGAAVQAGLTTNESDAEYLARYGITKEQAQQGYRTISGYLPRAQQLSSIYQKQVPGAYTQASAEREIFGTPGAAEEERKRKQITSLEQAAFTGSSGLTGGALGRERAGQF